MKGASLPFPRTLFPPFGSLFSFLLCSDSLFSGPSFKSRQINSKGAGLTGLESETHDPYNRRQQQGKFCQLSHVTDLLGQLLGGRACNKGLFLSWAYGH